MIFKVISPISIQRIEICGINLNDKTPDNPEKYNPRIDDEKNKIKLIK